MGAALVVSVDVVMRKLFAVSLGGADEIAGYALAIGSAWSFALALLERIHIRIDTLYIHMPALARALLDIVGTAALTGFLALVAWHGAGVLAQSLRIGAHSVSALETPVALPQALWIAGLVLFLLVALVVLVRALAALVTGDLAAVSSVVGSRSAVEETEDELRAAAAGRDDNARAP
jgi:TRAP-type mannitol/chloroaromatic compound transport system permease small subunit